MSLVFRYGYPKFFLFFLFLVLIFITIEQPAYSNEFVINVTGNKRTKTKFIRDLVEEYLTDDNITNISEVDEKNLKEHIYNTKLFSEVDIAIEEEKINVAIKERWTLISIPFFATSGDEDTKFGFFILERNFLGYGKAVSLGTMLSEDQESYFVMYGDKSVLSSNWTLMTNIGKSDNNYYIYKGEDKIYGINQESENLNLSVGYKFSNSFRSEIGIEGRKNIYHQLETYSVLNDYETMISSLNLRWDFSNYRLYFQEGIRANVGLKHQVYRDDKVDNYYGFLTNLSWQKQLFENNVLQALVKGSYIEDGDERDDLRIGGTSGFRGIFSSGVWVKGYLTGSLDYQIPLKFSKYGTWTIAPFCDIGYLRKRFPEKDTELYVASGLGTYFYLKNIAIPGAGLQVGHNTKYEEIFFKFSIGFTF
ncbi:MAG: BamA/TamA family outer membrane protein [bacterium]